MDLHESAPRLLERLEDSLSAAERTALEIARAWASAAGASLYCVGGGVRDLLLGRPHLDVDLAVDGDVALLATALAEQLLGATATIHPQFGAIRDRLGRRGGGDDRSRARTRTEAYAYPGALPAVSPAPILQDLARRDFTIHAMAVRLSGPNPGELLDPFGGQADIDARLLRLLHDQSFRDDPTRIFRLARYSARLSFGIEAETAALARRDATFLGATSPARVTHELERTFAEPRPEVCLLRLRDLRALTAFYPSFRVSATLADAYDRLRADGGGTVQMAEYLAATAALWPRPAIQGLAQVLELRADAISTLRELPAAVAALAVLAGEPSDPVAIVRHLSVLPLAAVRGAGAALGGIESEIASRYAREWRLVRPSLCGADILTLGIPAGPAVGRILQELRAGRLRGQISSVDQEWAFVRAWQSGNQPEGDQKR